MKSNCLPPVFHSFFCSLIVLCHPNIPVCCCKHTTVPSATSPTYFLLCCMLSCLLCHPFSGCNTYIDQAALNPCCKVTWRFFNSFLFLDFPLLLPHLFFFFSPSFLSLDLFPSDPCIIPDNFWFDSLPLLWLFLP